MRGLEVLSAFIALDGCHTKSHFHMTLLIACALDGNNEIIPLAWGIVPIEDTDNWTWFLLHMKECFTGMNLDQTVFISDRDKGLQTAVPDVFTNVYHSHCCQHIADNVQKYFGLQARNAFWKAAYTFNEYDFEDAISAI